MQSGLHPTSRPTVLRQVVLYGQPQEGKISFDHREESEPVGNYLSQMRLDSVNLWFLRTDNQNVALQGIGASFKKLNEDGFFEPLDCVDEKIRNSDRDYDILHLDEGEYIRGIKVTTATANGKIGAIEFITTKKGKKSVFCGYTRPVEEGKQNEVVPPGETKHHDFLKSEGDAFPGYVVGFFGQHDENHVTYLGVYIASLNEINYYARRPFILTYKKIQQDKNLLLDIAKKLGVEREGEKFKGAHIEDIDGNSSKTFLYFLDASLNHPELFKAVLEYL